MITRVRALVTPLCGPVPRQASPVAAIRGPVTQVRGLVACTSVFIALMSGLVAFATGRVALRCGRDADQIGGSSVWSLVPHRPPPVRSASLVTVYHSAVRLQP